MERSVNINMAYMTAKIRRLEADERRQQIQFQLQHQQFPLQQKHQFPLQQRQQFPRSFRI